MNYVRGAEQGYADGAVFSYKTALKPGEHHYYFEASDGSMTARFPESGTISVEVTKLGIIFLTAWIVTGVVVIALVIYFLIRRRRKLA